MLRMVTRLSKFPTSSSGLHGFQALSVLVIRLPIQITGHIMKMQETNVSFSAIWWSGASVTILILAIGIILYFYKRYQLNMKEAYTPGNFPRDKYKQNASNNLTS